VKESKQLASKMESLAIQMLEIDMEKALNLASVPLLPRCLRPSGEELRHTTQIAAHYAGLNCFRRLLPSWLVR
jgi:hypothetical protein